MGISPFYPIDNLEELERRFGAALVRSLSFQGVSVSVEDRDVKTIFRSLSFNGRDTKPTVRKSNGSGKMGIERSLSLEDRKLESKLSFKTPTAELDNPAFGRALSIKEKDAGDQSPCSSGCHKRQPTHYEMAEMGDEYEAALKLQKVYKSFRTRRRLADCAVLAEQRWWKVLDFAELKRSSISFFDIEKQETALSRWSRARTRAAKVGKGLSKDEKARKLALQHWLEAIDPRHRYGHNLQFYYVTWLHCESKQPFFYWLDIGEGREVNHERCPRSKLQQQCIKYLGPTERTNYEVVVVDGKLVYKKSGTILDTSGGPKDTKWIFVLSASQTLYVGQKCKGTFQHSSFLAGGATLSAGRLIVKEGVLKAVWPHSGHYLPTEENFQAFMYFLREHNVDLTNVQRAPDEEEEEASTIKCNSLHYDPPEAEAFEEAEGTDAKNSAQEDIDSREQQSNDAEKSPKQESRLSQFGSEVTRLEVPSRGDDVFDIYKAESHPPSGHSSPQSPDDGYETAEEFFSEEDFMFPKKNLFDEDDAEENEKHIPKEKIMLRIDSHKGMNSYQLAQHLSFRWSTGAGPRIGCMRDYPSELQFRVLEQVNLSPRASNASAIRSPFIPPTPTFLRRETRTGKSPLATEQGELCQTTTQ